MLTENFVVRFCETKIIFFFVNKNEKTIMKILNRDVIQQKHNVAKKKSKKLRQFRFFKYQFMNLNLSHIYSIIGRYSNEGFAEGKKNPGQNFFL